VKNIVICVLVMIPCLFTSSFASAANYTDSLLYKVTIWQNGEETEFEFENPTHYEWEKGKVVIKGQEAQQKVEEIFKLLNVTKETTKEEIKTRLEKNGFSNLDRFVIKWIDPRGNLYTWHWDQKKNETP